MIGRQYPQKQPVFSDNYAGRRREVIRSDVPYSSKAGECNHDRSGCEPRIFSLLILERKICEAFPIGWVHNTVESRHRVGRDQRRIADPMSLAMSQHRQPRPDEFEGRFAWEFRKRGPQKLRASNEECGVRRVHCMRLERKSHFSRSLPSYSAIRTGRFSLSINLLRPSQHVPAGIKDSTCQQTHVRMQGEEPLRFPRPFLVNSGQIPTNDGDE